MEFHSRYALSLIQSCYDAIYLAHSLVQSVRELLVCEWNVSLCHIYREANRSADKLARLEHFY